MLMGGYTKQNLIPCAGTDNPMQIDIPSMPINDDCEAKRTHVFMSSVTIVRKRYMTRQVLSESR